MAINGYFRNIINISLSFLYTIVTILGCRRIQSNALLSLKKFKPASPILIHCRVSGVFPSIPLTGDTSVQRCIHSIIP